MTVDEENIKLAYQAGTMTFKQAVDALISECDMMTMESEELVHSWDGIQPEDYVAPFERDMAIGDWDDVE